jgi:hypothetical protein
MTRKSDGDYDQVYLATGHLAAEMIRAFLESNGINAIINQESAGATLGLTVGSLGVVEVWVPREQADEAEKLLKEMDEGQFELPEEEAPEEDEQDSVV